MYTNSRFRGLLAAAVAAACALQGQAALTNNVPWPWNVAPPNHANGAYLEAFELVPNWAAGLTTAAVSYAGMPARSNIWFGTHTNVLVMDGSVAVTNAFTNNAFGNVTCSDKAVFVDMRVKFDALSEPPAAATLADAKLAIFVNAASNLVAAVYNQTWSTNPATLDLANWYQVTVKMKNGLFDVLTNDVPAFTNKTFYNAAPNQNVLKSLSLSGTGMLDDLYVSYGNPAYGAPMGAVPTTLSGYLGAGGEAVTNWLASFFNDGRLSATANFSLVSSAQIDAAYLLDTQLAGTKDTPLPVPCDFGVAAIDMTSPTNVIVTCRLKVNGSARSGTINGKVQLWGKQEWRDATWQVMSAAVAPVFGADGMWTQGFDVTSDYKFFEARIVAP